MYRSIQITGIIINVFFLSTCSNSDKKEAVTTTTTSAVTGSTVSNNISTVESSMIPGSLVIGTSLKLLSNPCADTDGFFDCQPELLKLYMALAKAFVRQAVAIIDDIAPGIDTLDAGTGTFATGDSGGFTQVSYNKVSSSEWEFIAFNNTTPAMYLSVDGTDYTFRADMDNFPEDDESSSEDDDGGSGKIEAVISYTSDSEYEVDVRLIDSACNNSDVRAPQNIAIHINKTTDLWQGKAVMYLPRWLFSDGDGVTCSTTPTSSMSMFIYTDFVGDATNSTASLYMMPSTVTSTDSFSTYEASNFCTNYDNLCFGGRGFGDVNPVSSYENPFCATSSDATWGGACTSTNSSISAGTYSAATNWILPADIASYSVDLPSTVGSSQ